MEDLVNHPDHYQSDEGIEAIEAIEASMSAEGFQGYLKGNALKYLWRWDKKSTDPKLRVQDLEKAQWYLNRLKSYALQEGERDD